MYGDVPTIMVFTENFKDDGEKYKGPWDWKKISSFATKKMQDFVSVITEANYMEFMD